MIRKYYKFIFLSILIITLIGCATIVHGGRQKIPVKSTPSGATVTINKIRVNTPGVIKLSRFEPTAVLRFEKEGYEPVEVTLVRTMDGWIWGNVAIGGIIGVAIDFATGAAYQLSPNQVNVTLKALGYKEARATGPKEEVKEAPQDRRVVAVDVLSRPSSYSEYYRLVYRTIAKKVVMPQGAPGGAVNVGVTILADGALENVDILGNSSEEMVLREAVIKAVKDSPPFPDDIKEGRKAFTLMIEFRQNY